MNEKKKLSRPVIETIDESLIALREIRQSGYWPFASPAPCSTEKKIKDAISKAIEQLEIARYNHQLLFGKGRAPMSSGQSVIIEMKA